MKKICLLTLIFSLLISLQSNAIGLPNNAYIQKELEQRNNASLVNGFAKTPEEKVAFAISKVNNTEESTINTEDFSTYIATLIDNVVNTIMMAFLSIFSASHAIADELHVLHNSIFFEVPQQC